MVTSFIGTGRLTENLYAWSARVQQDVKSTVGWLRQAWVKQSRAYNPPEDTRQPWQWHLTHMSGILGNSMEIAPQLHVPLIGAMVVVVVGFGLQKQ